MILSEKAALLSKAITTLDNFIHRFGMHLPGDIQEAVSVSICTQGVELTISLQHADEQDRYNALAAIGKALGRSGWTADPDYYKEWYTWTKTIEMVLVRINGAEAIPKHAKGIPVPANKFPLLLQEASA